MHIEEFENTYKKQLLVTKNSLTHSLWMTGISFNSMAQLLNDKKISAIVNGLMLKKFEHRCN